MRKVLLTLCAFLLTAATAGAQGLQFKKYSLNRETLNPMKVVTVNKAAKAETDTQQWGYADPSTDPNEWLAIGIKQTAKLSGAYFVEGKGALKGAKIAAIDVPSLDNNTTGVTVWIRNSLTGENIASKTYSGKIVAGTFQRIDLDTPVDIPESGFYVGYTCTSLYLVCVGNGTEKNRVLLQVEDQAWDDYYKQGWGALLMQLELTNVNIPDYSAASFTSLGSQVTACGAAGSFDAKLQNTGGKPINSIDYSLTVDGVKSTGHYDFTTPVPAGLNPQYGTATINFTSPAEVKNYDVSLSIDKVNGEDNADKDNVSSATFTNVTRAATRRSVVEEFTGTACGYCPRGYAGMETMKERYPDTFVGIALHRYNSSDAMYVGTAYPLNPGATGAPSCWINNGDVIDPYFGSGLSTTRGILADLEEANSKLPMADVTVSAEYNADSTAVVATGTVEYLGADLDLSLAYVLKADSLTGTTAAWKQTSYYAGASTTAAGVLDEMPLLKEFCAGGKWNKSSVALVYNDVQIGGSYVSQRNQAPALSGDNTPGSKATTTYTMKFPSKSALKKAIRFDEVWAVAVVYDNNTGLIVNAAQVKVKPTTAGIQSIGNAVSTTARVVGRYTVDGRRISAPVKGINIIKMSDGTTRKVMVNE